MKLPNLSEAVNQKSPYSVFNYYNPKSTVSVVPQTFGGGTYRCNCPGGSTTCNSNESCICDFWGARCQS